MRPIKFRAWDKDLKKFVNAPFKNQDRGTLYAIGHEQDCLLLQFTGLTDKNGAEIWEGDVINYGDYPDGNGPCNYIVVWDTDGALYEIRAINKKGVTLFLDPDGAVVGNIYENPELLK